MGTLIDSSVLVAVERRSLDFDAVMAEGGEEAVGIAAITASGSCTAPIARQLLLSGSAAKCS